MRRVKKKPPKEFSKKILIVAGIINAVVIVFTLTPQDISRYSPELHAWCAAPGRYEIRIGHSSRDIRAVLAFQYADAKI